MTTERATADDAGCWIDGHWGQYGTDRLVQIASAWGFVGSGDERDRLLITYCSQRVERDEATALAALLPLMTPDERDAAEWQIAEEVYSLADDAESWLNEHAAPEGYSFGWHDGEFFLWSTETWEEESY